MSTIKDCLKLTKNLKIRYQNSSFLIKYSRKNNAKQIPGKTNVTRGVKIEGKKDADILIYVKINFFY